MEGVAIVMAEAHHAPSVRKAGKRCGRNGISSGSGQRTRRRADALNNLGIILAQCGQKEAASDLLARALEVRPDSPDTRSNLANLYVKLGRVDEAIDCYRKAARSKNPQHVDALHNLASLYETHRIDTPRPPTTQSSSTS